MNTLLDSLIAWGFSRSPEGPATMSWAGGAAYPLEPGAVAALYYGERLYQFPLGIFGVALGTVLFPLFARHAAAGDRERLRGDLTLGLRLVLAVGVPASLGLVWLALPISRLLFQHGSFQAADSARAAAVIAAYGSGVWAYCGQLILYRAFYAIGDRGTPVRVGAVAVALNLLLNLSLIWFLAERGLAVSTALAATLQVCLLVRLIQARIGSLDWTALRSTFWRTILASAAMLAACQIGIGIAGPQPDKVAGLLLPLLCASAAFLAAAWLLKLEEFWMLVRRQRAA